MSNEKNFLQLNVVRRYIRIRKSPVQTPMDAQQSLVSQTLYVAPDELQVEHEIKTKWLALR